MTGSWRLRGAFVGLGVLVLGSAAAAAKTDPVFVDDPYHAYHPSPPSSWEDGPGRYLVNFPVVPFELTRGGVERVLIFLDEYHVKEKVDWGLDALRARGIHLGPGGLPGAGGGRIEWRRDGLGWPRTSAAVHAAASWGFDQGYGARVTVTDLLDTPAALTLSGGYQDLAHEVFSGIGPTIREGKTVNYRDQTLRVSGLLAVPVTRTIGLEATAGYSNTNILNGRDDEHISIKRAFTRRSLPGLEGAALLHAEMAVRHETRDVPEDPARGGYEVIRGGYHEGVQGAAFGYYQAGVELARFVTLSSHGQVLALHGYGEVNEEPGRDRIPFFDLARLGGWDAAELLRGFPRQRYAGKGSLLFNIEYRYPIWKFRELGLDAVVFWDEGQVFDDIPRISAERFEESVGFGFRAKHGRHVKAGVEVGFSDEDITLGVRSSAAF